MNNVDETIDRLRRHFSTVLEAAFREGFRAAAEEPQMSIPEAEIAEVLAWFRSETRAASQKLDEPLV